MPILFSNCARGENLFSTFLRQRPIAPDLDSLIADWMVGAETTMPSSTIASCFPTSLVVTSPNVFAPAPFSVKSTCQPGWALGLLCCAVRGTNTAVAFFRAAPVIWTGPSCNFSSAPGS